MSHGKTDNNSADLSLLDRVNNRLARLMGKRDPRQPLKNNPPSNGKFALIILAMLISLWLLTGVYYVQDKSYGLVLQQGRVSKVLSGLHIGITWPYPFADVVILDSSSSNLSIGKSPEGSRYLLLSADGHALGFSAEVAYQITDPQLYFNSFYQDTLNQDQRIGWIIMTLIQDYMLHHESKWLVQNSLIVSSNEIRQLSDSVLANYGLKLSKLSLNSINNLSPESAPALAAEKTLASDDQLAYRLLAEAHQYKSNKAMQTESLLSEYQQLLPQYRANHQAIIELIYYKMLSNLAAESAGQSFTLLNLSLEQLRQLQAHSETGSLTVGTSESVSDIRQLNRTVNRQRQFKER